MLNNLDNDEGSFDFGKHLKKEESEKDRLFALGDSNEHYNRVTRNFKIAQSRALNTLNTSDYFLNPEKRIKEEPLENIEAQAFEKALFYMYGACESLEEDDN